MVALNIVACSSRPTSAVQTKALQVRVLPCLSSLGYFGGLVGAASALAACKRQINSWVVFLRGHGKKRARLKLQNSFFRDASLSCKFALHGADGEPVGLVRSLRIAL